MHGLQQNTVLIQTTAKSYTEEAILSDMAFVTLGAAPTLPHEDLQLLRHLLPDISLRNASAQRQSSTNVNSKVRCTKWEKDLWGKVFLSLFS